MSLFVDFMNSMNSSAGADNFGVKLFELVWKADRLNTLKLEVVYPAHVELLRWWRGQPQEPSPKEIEEKANELEARYGD